MGQLIKFKNFAGGLRMGNVVKYDLETPITVDDKKIETLELDLDRVNGKALLSIPSYEAINSPSGLFKLAGAASGVVPEDLESLSGTDALEVISIIRLFLQGRLDETQYGSQLEPSKKS
jgi:hypothetical protein